MSFGRWILIHSFSILVVAILLSAFYFREELLLDKALQQLFSLDTATVTAFKSDSDADTRENNEKPDDQNQVTVTEPPTVAELEVKKLQQNTAATKANIQPAQLPPSVTSKPDTKQLLFRARDAFWEKQIDESVTLYRQLIELEPGNADFHGELGNVFHSTGFLDKAIEEYRICVELLEQKGDFEQANRLRQLVSSGQINR